MTLIYLSIAWIIGILLGSKLTIPWWIIFFGLVPFCFIPLFLKHKKHLIVAGFCLLFLCGGALRYQTSLPRIDEHQLQYYNERGFIAVQGTVSTEPEPGNTTISFQLSADTVLINGQSTEASGKALVRTSQYQDYHYGDTLKMTGELEPPAETDSSNYRNYLARHGIYSVINYPSIEVLDTGKGTKPLAWIYSLRNRLSQSLARAMPEPQASLAQGILLGIRGNIPHSLNQAFSRTGTTHVLAISGINISIVIGMFLAAGIWLFGKRYSIYIWLALILIWLYALLTGMNPPVVRGAIMGSIFLIAELLGRPGSALTALTFAAAIMVAIEPQVLWDASFQLSFLAMAGLILIAPYLQAWGNKGMNTGRERSLETSLGSFAVSSFAITFAATLVTWPVIAYYFQVASLVGLPATFFSVLALPAIIITAALVAVVGLFLPPVAWVLGWISWLCISYFIIVVRIFDALPLSSIRLEGIQIWQLWIYYTLLAIAIATIYYRQQLTALFHRAAAKISPYLKTGWDQFSRVPKRWVITPLLIIAIVMWVAILNFPDDKLHVSVLDVGQGDAILIQTPAHQNILIDGGPSPSAIDLELSEKLPFWDRKIDLVILTEPQADHVTGVIEVLRKYAVYQVYETGLDYKSTAYQQWLSLTKTPSIKREIAHSQQQIELGDGMRIEVLHPPPAFLEGTSNDLNNNGLILRLSWNSVSFLFTSDIQKEAEWYITGQGTCLNSTVLKVGHHGSATSTSEQFLAAVDPEIAVVSVGSENRFGLPSSEVINRLSVRLSPERVYLTSTNGTIEFLTDGTRLWIKCDK